MALTGNWAMCGKRNNSATIGSGSNLYRTTTKDLKSESFGMANGLGLIKHRKSSVHKPLLICSAPSFIHWSRKIPICDGYHEFV